MITDIFKDEATMLCIVNLILKYCIPRGIKSIDSNFFAYDTLDEVRNIPVYQGLGLIINRTLHGLVHSSILLGAVPKIEKIKVDSDRPRYLEEDNNIKKGDILSIHYTTELLGDSGGYTAGQLIANSWTDILSYENRKIVHPVPAHFNTVNCPLSRPSKCNISVFTMYFPIKDNTRQKVIHISDKKSKQAVYEYIKGFMYKSLKCYDDHNYQDMIVNLWIAIEGIVSYFMETHSNVIKKKKRTIDTIKCNFSKTLEYNIDEDDDLKTCLEKIKLNHLYKGKYPLPGYICTTIESVYDIRKNLMHGYDVEITDIEAAEYVTHGYLLFLYVLPFLNISLSADVMSMYIKTEEDKMGLVKFLLWQYILRKCS